MKATKMLKDLKRFEDECADWKVICLLPDNSFVYVNDYDNEGYCLGGIVPDLAGIPSRYYDEPWTVADLIGLLESEGDYYDPNVRFWYFIPQYKAFQAPWKTEENPDVKALMKKYFPSWFFDSSGEYRFTIAPAEDGTLFFKYSVNGEDVIAFRPKLPDSWRTKAADTVAGGDRLLSFLMTGGKFVDPDQEVLDSTKEGDSLLLQPEFDNAFDSNAILLTTTDGRKLGYVAKDVNPIIAALLRRGDTLTAMIGCIKRPARGAVSVRVDLYGQLPK